jgi:hypothetical protein
MMEVDMAAAEARTLAAVSQARADSAQEKKQMDRPQTVTIEACLNGFVSRVGCQTVVHTDVDQLATDLAEYLKDPGKKMKEFIAKACNGRAFMGDQCPGVDTRPEAAPIAPLVPPAGLQAAADTSDETAP